MPYFRNIVVALDFSKTSEEALRVAREVAADHSARLHLVHVVADVRLAPARFETPGPSFDDLQRQWVCEAEARLAAVAHRGADEAEMRKALVGTPVAGTIVEYAAANNADLIVVGTHGYGPVKRMLLGSVSDQLLRCAPCPVLTVPPGSSRTATGTLAKADYVGS
jgi:nucleotide-binding universal stress UspA family protein